MSFLKGRFKVKEMSDEPPMKADQQMKDAERYRRLYEKQANMSRDAQFVNLNPNRTYLGAIHKYLQEEPGDEQARQALNYFRDTQKDVISREYGARAVALKTNEDMAREVGKFLKPSEEETRQVDANFLQRLKSQYTDGYVVGDAQLTEANQGQLHYLNNRWGAPPQL